MVGLVVVASLVGASVDVIAHRGPVLSRWHYSLGRHVRWSGQLYRVTHTDVTAHGRQIALWRSFGRLGGQYAVFAIQGVPDRDALAIQTSQGYVLAVRIRKALPLDTLP
jgi:hypothetical protein